MDRTILRSMSFSSVTLLTVDDADNERLQFQTPADTPGVFDPNSTQEYFDPECSFSQQDYQRRMSNFPGNIEEALRLFSPSDTDEHESDVQDQHPTEATDSSDDRVPLPIVQTTLIDDSLSVSATEEQISIVSSPTQTIEPVEGGFPLVTSDNEPTSIEEPTERPMLNCSLSICVPCTDVQTGIPQANAAETTCASDLTVVKKKSDKNDLGHIMISYNHSTKIICAKIAKYLRQRNYTVWIDQDDISGDILTAMATAVENSFVVLMAINEKYHQSRYCRLEAEYSIEQNKASIPMLMQAGYKAAGWLGIINGSKLHIDFSQMAFEEAFHLLVREIEAVRIGLGAERNDRAVAMPADGGMATTTDATWSHRTNVHEWSMDDVSDWLRTERLEIYERSLRHFTGATLWQLYKVKFDSPSDYYRMVDSLLSPDEPLRLLHNLTFNGALESLFATSSQTIHR